MFQEYFTAGGPVMYAVLAAWILVLAGILDRGLYALGALARRPRRRVLELLEDERTDEARRELAREREREQRGVARIDGVSQLATSVGLFGTVLGIAQAFLARGGDAAGPEALSSGLSTALFTTIAGLAVFLVGQGFLIAYREWCAHNARGLEVLLGPTEEGSDG